LSLTISLLLHGSVLIFFWHRVSVLREVTSVRIPILVQWVDAGEGKMASPLGLAMARKGKGVTKAKEEGHRVLGVKNILAWGNIPPNYPEIALSHGWEGTVKLRLWIDSNGKVTAVDLVESSGFRALDRTAMERASEWKIPKHIVPSEEKNFALMVPVEYHLAEEKL
jgi:TonB family protein